MGYGFWLPLWYLLAICSSIIFRFWLHPWYLLAICSSMIYRFWLPLGIFWPLCCLFFYDLQILNTPLVSFGHLFFYDIQILITPLVSFGHCVVCSSMIYRFWLHPWYLLAIVLSVLLWFTDSDYPLGIFWPLCCLFFYDLRILIIPWDLLAIVLSVLLWFTDSDYPLVSLGHCIVCFSMIYRFWLHPWYLSAIVLFSVLLWYTDSDYPLGIFWALCCLFFYDIKILITPLVSFGHCVVFSSMIYRFWLHPWYLLAIVSVLLWYKDSDYPLGIFWPLCCLFFYDIQIMITPLVSFGHCVVCSSMIYRFWLHPWYILAIVLSVLLWYTDSDNPLGIIRPLCCVFFYDIPILIIPLVSFDHCVVFCSSMIYRFWLHPWYLLAIFSSMIYRFWLHSCYLLAIVLSVLLWVMDSDYTLGIFWPLCLFFYDLGIVIYPLVSFGHCVVCSSMIYRFWLHLWYLLVISSSMIYRFWLHHWCLSAIVLSVLLWYTDSDYTLGIFWSLCCLFFYDIQILIAPLVSFGHCVVFCSSMIYRFWLPLGIFWPLCCLFLYDTPILITPLVSFRHCVCSSMI